MRDHGDSNNFWAEFIKILGSKIFDRDFQIKGPVSTAGPLADTSRFLQKLEHCSGENAKTLHNHLKQSKLKIKVFGINPHSREVVSFIVSFLMGNLGNWVANHADETFKLESIDALTANIRASLSNADLEGMNLYSLINLDHFDKSLHEYTFEFHSS